MIEALIFLAGAAVGAFSWYHFNKPKAEPTAQTKGTGGPGPFKPK